MTEKPMLLTDGLDGEDVGNGGVPQWPDGLSKRPRGRPPKHGAYTGDQMMPITEEKKREILAVLHGNKVAVAITDMPYVELLSRALAKIEMFDRYMAVHGLFETDDKGNVMPAAVLKVYFAAVNSASRMCEALGLTPRARVALGMGMMQAEDLAAKMRDSNEEPA